MKTHVLLLFIVVIVVAACSRPTADTVLIDGAVYTVDADRNWAEAVAIDDGRIIYVGDSGGAEDYITSDTRVIDLDGRMLLPGFHDSHVHPMVAGTRIFRCQLGGLAWPEEVLDAIRECAIGLEEGEWFRGVDLDDTLFADGRLSRELLDAILPANVAVITNFSGFGIWTNSLGLRVVGLSTSSPDPKYGAYGRDPVTGELTGVLIGPAGVDLYRAIPPASMDKLRESLRSITEVMHGFGITSVNEAQIRAEHWAAFVKADEAREIRLRIQGSQYWDPERGIDQISAIVDRRAGARGQRFRADAVKFFLDGDTYQRTAALIQPYEGTSDQYGELAFDSEALNAIAASLDAEGFQLHFHAVGDAAVRQALDAIETAVERNGARDRRHQVAHLVLVDPEDLPRFAELNVVADFQALWAKSDLDRASDVALLGVERAGRLIQIQSMLDSGARVVLGSDWISESMDPLFGIQIAVTRQPIGAEAEPWLPEERISLEDALAAYTINGAWLARQDDITGSIEVGKAADLIVLSDNLFEIEARSIVDTKVEITIFDGVVVWESAR